MSVHDKGLAVAWIVLALVTLTALLTGTRLSWDWWMVSAAILVGLPLRLLWLRRPS